MNSCFRAAFVSAIISTAAACTSVKPPPSPHPPPPPAVRSSEEIARRIATVAQEDFGPAQIHVAQAMRAFARVYQEQLQYGVAEVLYQRALTIQQSTPDADARGVEATLHELSGLYRMEKNWAKAEPLLQEIVLMAETNRGQSAQNSLQLAQALQDLANFYEQQGQYAKAEPLLERAMSISQETRGTGGMMTDIIMSRLAGVYGKEGKTADAERMFKTVLTNQESRYGADDPRLSSTLRRYASLLRDMGKADEADQLEHRAQEIMSRLRMQPQSSTNLPPGTVRVPFRRDE